ncbi:YrzI family small protein [Alkalihalophilus marmarensis]|nr:YrzI family small protein [Alkalihalophilus marmarensis]MEC2072093.1 YrzI family small protein [Alkalihalophilus marmarensis]
MTLSFIFFTITIKKRNYSGKDLERLVEQQKYEDQIQQRLARFQHWM